VRFNIYWGQMRAQPTGVSISVGEVTNGVAPPKVSGVSGTGMYYQRKGPKKAIMMAALKPGGHTERYDADELGNIVIVGPAHLEAMRGLGWPIYIGSGSGPVVWEDLLWPRLDLADDPYFRCIQEVIRNGQARP